MNLEKSENSSTPPLALNRQASQTRRKLVRGGLIGAPVLLALKSTPVLAANCKLPSGFSVSGNLSHPENYVCTPNPPGPSTWVNTIPEADKSLSFQTTLQAPPLDNNVTTLLSALSTTTLDSLIVAAWLNAKYGHIPDLTTDMVTDMWRLGVQGGGYTPIAGTTWHVDQVQAYLQYLMP